MYSFHHLGPDSKNSYNVWRDIQRTVDLSNRRVQLTYQVMPLQFHYYAFKLHTGDIDLTQPSSMLFELLIPAQ